MNEGERGKSKGIWEEGEKRETERESERVILDAEEKRSRSTSSTFFVFFQSASFLFSNYGGSRGHRALR